MNKTELSKIECLQKANITALPPKAEPDTYWSRAILKVLKGDGNETYVLQGTDFEGKLCIKFDPEDTYAIVKVLEAYPLKTFSPVVLGFHINEVPRANMIKFLNFSSYTVESWVPGKSVLDVMSDEELINCCIRLLRFRDDTQQLYQESLVKVEKEKAEEIVALKSNPKPAKKATKKTTKKSTKTKDNGKDKKAKK